MAKGQKPDRGDLAQNEGGNVSEFNKATAKAMVKKCDECGRVFDLRFEESAAEWFHGHDCEEEMKAFDEWLAANPHLTTRAT